MVAGRAVARGPGERAETPPCLHCSLLHGEREITLLARDMQIWLGTKINNGAICAFSKAERILPSQAIVGVGRASGSSGHVPTRDVSQIMSTHTLFLL